MRRPLALGVLLALAAGAAPSQTQTPTPVPGFAERVEVNVRTIFVVVVDSKGRALGRPLGPGDVEVLEDGIPAQVLGVDTIRPLAAGSPAASAALPASPSAATSPKPAPAGPIQTLPQFLYVDTSLMQKQSVKRVAETVEKNLEAILSRGPLEIVVADPDPKVFLARTSDASQIRGKLSELSRTVSGRERMRDIRRDLDPRIGGNAVTAARSEGIQRQARARAGMREEIALVRQTLDRLDRWAAGTVRASRDRLPRGRRLRREPGGLLGEPAPGRRKHGAAGAGQPVSKRGRRRDPVARGPLREDARRGGLHGGDARARPSRRDVRGRRGEHGQAQRQSAAPAVRRSAPVHVRPASRTAANRRGPDRRRSRDERGGPRSRPRAAFGRRRDHVQDGPARGRTVPSARGPKPDRGRRPANGALGRGGNFPDGRGGARGGRPRRVCGARRPSARSEHRPLRGEEERTPGRGAARVRGPRQHRFRARPGRAGARPRDDRRRARRLPAVRFLRRSRSRPGRLRNDVALQRAARVAVGRAAGLGARRGAEDRHVRHRDRRAARQGGRRDSRAGGPGWWPHRRDQPQRSRARIRGNAFGRRASGLGPARRHAPRGRRARADLRQARPERRERTGQAARNRGLGGRPVRRS